MGKDTEFPRDCGLIKNGACSTIQLNDSRAGDALAKIFVGRTNNDAIDAWIPGGGHSRSRKRIIGLKFDHRPNYNACRRQNLFKPRELGQKIGLDTFTGLIIWPQLVAEGFDHVIGGDRDMRCPFFDHAQHGGQNPANRSNFMPLVVTRRRQRVVVPKQFVGAVY